MISIEIKGIRAREISLDPFGKIERMSWLEKYF